MVTFRVDDVSPATAALPTMPLGNRFPEALVVGGDPALPVLEADGVHPLRPSADHHPLWRGEGRCPITTLIDLPDGSSSAAATEFTTQKTHWVVCRIEQVATERQGGTGRKYQLVGAPADIPVYGTSLALLLDAALDSGGDITHLETGRLDQLDGPAV